ncbi:MAG: hypothetical protein PCFJNLEI_00848 [Verrucomicrobiae bacterium]|nr:hypothetical protein [Verrucomicrobiae bacterium]
MPTTNQLGMLKLTISPVRDAEYLRLVAEQIQQLPGVVRVRTTPATLQIEIIYRQPAAGLLRAVHVALRLAGTEIVAGKAF